MKKAISFLILCAIVLNYTTVSAETRLSESQKKTADKIAEITDKNWDEYGVLPSIAVSQAFIESSLGVNQVKLNNLWGIRPGGMEHSAYSSLDDGIMAYLNVINNGYYDKALHKKDYHEQLRCILDGGYYGEDDGGTIDEYYKNCIKSIEKYDFDEYDKKLFCRLEKEQKEIEENEKTYPAPGCSNLKQYKARTDKKITDKKTVQIWKDNKLKGIYDVIENRKDSKTGVSDLGFDTASVKIIVCEEVKD